MLSSLLEDGDCCIVIATSALEIGFNMPNIQQIVHYGTPPDLERYVKEVCHGGGDGQSCRAILFYLPLHLAHCDEHMRNYSKNRQKVQEGSSGELFLGET